jgi:hypothetical protein
MGYIPKSAINQIVQLTGKPVGQLHVFDALGVTTAAVADDHIHIVGRDIAAPHIAVIIVFAVKWTDV